MPAPPVFRRRHKWQQSQFGVVSGSVRFRNGCIATVIKRSRCVAFVSVFIIIIPALWLILTSFKTNENIFRLPAAVHPEPVHIQNYIDVLQRRRFPALPAQQRHRQRYLDR